MPPIPENSFASHLMANWSKL